MGPIWLAGRVLVRPALFYKYGIQLCFWTHWGASSRIFWNHPSPMHLLWWFCRSQAQGPLALSGTAASTREAHFLVRMKTLTSAHSAASLQRGKQTKPSFLSSPSIKGDELQLLCILTRSKTADERTDRKAKQTEVTSSSAKVNLLKRVKPPTRMPSPCVPGQEKKKRKGNSLLNNPIIT